MEFENEFVAFKMSDLIVRDLNNELSAAEKAELQRWLDATEVNQQLYNEFATQAGRSAALADIEQYQFKPALLRVEQQINKETVKLSPQGLRIKGIIAVRIAAALVAITLGVWLYYASGLFGSRHPELVSGSQYTNDVKPGKNTATITLANGKIITLSDAKTGIVVDAGSLKYNDNSDVDMNGRHPEFSSGSRTRPAAMLTASTPRGGTYQVTLPDGSKVWLNADSKISFPSQFSGKERKILLSGEAYFEVSQNKRMPFIVESNGQQVEVLGTHFNINAYKDEASTKTTLLEGSVSVRHAEFISASRNRKTTMQGKEVILLPNQQSVVTSNNQIEVKQADPNATAWVKGKFSFNNTPLPDVMRQLARWYDVEVVYPQGRPDRKFTGDINRNLNASEALSLLDFMKVKFKIEGKRIIVTK